MSQAIRTSLWFDDRLEEALALYTEVFPNSEVISKSYMPEGGPAPAGSLLAANFKLNGVEFIAINGGPMFKFTEAISLEIKVETQEEVDHYWYRLSEGGEESQCGWLKDRFGLSWQVVPTILHQLFSDPDPDRASRAMQAMLQMRKLDIAELIAAADGTS
jgi:predicted 3-demethylubiquinone-9 3-methyltransferase (glyoxalase superfamily)